MFIIWIASVLTGQSVKQSWRIYRCWSAKLWYLQHNSVQDTIPDSKVHGANMGPTWVLSAPDGPHVGPMNLAIRDSLPTRQWYAHALHFAVLCCGLITSIWPLLFRTDSLGTGQCCYCHCATEAVLKDRLHESSRNISYYHNSTTTITNKICWNIWSCNKTEVHIPNR